MHAYGQASNRSLVKRAIPHLFVQLTRGKFLDSSAKVREAHQAVREDFAWRFTRSFETVSMISPDSAVATWDAFEKARGVLAAGFGNSKPAGVIEVGRRRSLIGASNRTPARSEWSPFRSAARTRVLPRGW